VRTGKRVTPNPVPEAPHRTTPHQRHRARARRSSWSKPSAGEPIVGGPGRLVAKDWADLRFVPHEFVPIAHGVAVVRRYMGTSAGSGSMVNAEALRGRVKR
jgi:hypothetical protein